MESAGARRQRYGIAEALQRDEMAIYASSVPVAIPRRWVEEREDKKTPQAAAAAEEQAQAGLPPAEPPHSASPDEEDDDTVRQGLARWLHKPLSYADAWGGGAVNCSVRGAPHLLPAHDVRARGCPAFHQLPALLERPRRPIARSERAAARGKAKLAWRPPPSPSQPRGRNNEAGFFDVVLFVIFK